MPHRPPHLPFRAPPPPALVAALLLALAVRLAFLPHATIDAPYYLFPWLAAAEAKGAGYLAHGFTNYTAFYEHCLALLAHLPGPAIVRIKALSVLFDVALAGATALLVPAGARRAAFAAVLLLPTVAMNSALLAQSDAIWATAAVLALAAAQRDRPVAAMLAFSAALAIKLQALLFAPVLALLMLGRRQPPWTVALLPAAYLLFALPMIVAGRPLAEVFGVYGGQYGTFRILSANAPSLWAFAQPFVEYERGIAIGLPFAVAVTGAAILLLWRARLARTREGLLLAAAILLLLVPFVTPKMHDRYFYLADPVLVALLFAGGRRYAAAMVAAQLGSLLAYLPFIADGTILADPVFGRDGAIAQRLGVNYQMLPVLGAASMGLALALLVREARRLADPHPLRLLPPSFRPRLASG